MPSSASVAIAAATSAVRQQDVEVGEGQHEHAEHPVGAVDQRQPLLGLQRRAAPTPAAASAAAPVDERAVGQPRLALAEQDERRRRERSEVTAGAERAVLAHDGRDAGVEQGEHRVDDDRPGAGVAHRQAAGAQQDHRPDRLALDLRTHPGGVRADQRRLQLGRPLGGDHRVGQRAEAGRHAVDRLRLVHQPLDDGGAALDHRSGVVAEHDPSTAAGDGDDVGGRDAVRPEHQRRSRPYPRSRRVS